MNDGMLSKLELLIEDAFQAHKSKAHHVKYIDNAVEVYDEDDELIGIMGLETYNRLMVGTGLDENDKNDAVKTN